MLRLIGWIILLAGLLMTLAGQVSGPSPGSEWPVFEIVGPLLAGVGALIVLLAAVLRRWRRR